MAFGFAGAAAGASNALQQIRATDEAKQEQAIRLQILMQQLAQGQASEQRASRDQQLQEAQLALGQAEAVGDPGADVSSLAPMLAGTPFASRLQTQQTLPSTTQQGDPLTVGLTKRTDPGRSVTNLVQTQEQRQAAGQQSAQRRLVELTRIGGPRNELLATMQEAGQTVPASAFPPPEDPEAPARETRSLEVQAADALRRGDTAEYQRLLQVQKEMAQVGARASTSTALSPAMESNVLNRLTTQWQRAVQPVVELERQSKLMQEGLEAARRGDMAPGAQAVLVTFQKILDPTSVVRESEYARSAAGQALLAQVQGAVERLAIGGAGVPYAELVKFARLADEAVAALSVGYIDAVKARIGRTADRYKIPQDLVFEDYSFGRPPSPQDDAAETGSGATLMWDPQRGWLEGQ